MAAKEKKPKQNVLKKDLMARKPSSVSINFFEEEAAKKSNSSLLVGLLGVVAAIAVFAYFGILTPLNDLKSAQSELKAAETQLASAQAANEDYDEVRSEWIRYSYGYLTDDEAKLVDRKKILDKIEGLLMPYGSLSSMSISGNEVNATMYNLTMEEEAEAVELLNTDPEGDILVAIPNRSNSQEETETGEQVDTTIGLKIKFVDQEVESTAVTAAEETEEQEEEEDE